MVSPHLSMLSPPDRELLEAWLVGFDQSWNDQAFASQAGRLNELPEHVRAAALVELVKIDLERQWQHGARVTLDTYLRDYPALGTPESVASELVLAEYEVRRQFHGRADLEEFVERFPRQEQELRRLLVEAESARSGASAAPVALPPQAEHDTSKAALSTDGGTEAQSTRKIPREFGRYRIVKRLGEGGMGAVYLAHDTQLDRQVALKIPRFSAKKKGEIVDRFFREARAAATIRHPNVCPVYDVGENGGIHYLTMAYIEGHTLSEFIRPGKPLPERQVASVVCKLAIALQEAHDCGVVHRDLKPSNVMIDRRNEPVIMDFGLARRTDAEESRATQQGAILGTPAYMSPEQVLGEPDQIGPHTDVYSLGVIFYELLAGRVPYQGTPTAVIGQILGADPPPPQEHREDLDPKLAAICSKAMAKKREERYGSMKELAADLTEYLKHARKGPTKAAADVGSEGAASRDSMEQAFANIAVSGMRTARRSSPKPLAERLQQLAPLARRHRKILVAIAAGFFFLFLCGVIITIKLRDRTVTVKSDNPNTTVEVSSDGANVSVQTRSLTSAETVKTEATNPASSGQPPLPHFKATRYATAVQPAGIRFDEDGYLYVGHNKNRAVKLRRVPPGGGEAEDWGDSSFTDPDAVDIYGSHVYVPNHKAVWRVLRETGATECWAEFARNHNVTALTVDADGDYGGEGDVYIGQRGSIVRLTVDGTETTIAESPYLKAPRDLQFAQGCLYCVEANLWEGILIIDRDGSVSKLDDGGFTWGSPTALAYHPGEDAFYVGDATLGQILRLPRTGGAPTVVPCDFGTEPVIFAGLAFDPKGNLYVSDRANDVIWRLTPPCGQPPLAIAPFNAAQAKQYQQAWADYLGLPVEREFDLPGGEKLTMELIPPGEFMMGSLAEEQASLVEATGATNNDFLIERISTEIPRHRVRISQPFWLSRHEITRDHFRQFVNDTGYKTEPERDGHGGLGIVGDDWIEAPKFIWSTDPGFPQTDDHPVVNVTWNDAAAFCDWLSEKEDETWGLPTEAQWEYACCAGTTTLYSSGNSPTSLGDCAWLRGNSDSKTHPVGQKSPNAWGLHDMHGNVWEWCADWAGGYDSRVAVDPGGPRIGSARIDRGGCWNSPASLCRSAYRDRNAQSCRHHCVGFRVACKIAVKGEKDRQSPLKTKSPDRRAAEWVLRLGGWIHVTSRAEQIHRLADLPGVPLQVSHVNLRMKPGLTTEALQNLEGLAALRVLEMAANPQIGPAAIKYLASLTSLNLLELGDAQLTDEGMQRLAGLKGLQHLLIWNTGITDASLEVVAKMKALKRLSAGTNQITGKGLTHLRALKSLETLTLPETQLTDEDLKLLAAFPKLRDLDLSRTLVTDAGLPQLKTLDKLESLRLRGLPITGTGLAKIAELNKEMLLDLELGDTKITDQGLQHLADFKPRMLMLDANDIKGPGLDKLNPERLVNLALRHTSIDDAGIKHLARMGNLNHLALDGTVITDSALDVVGKLDKLQGLSLIGTEVTDTGLEKLKNLNDLGELLLHDTRVSAAGVERLQTALPTCRVLWDAPTKTKAPATNWTTADGIMITP